MWMFVAAAWYCAAMRLARVSPFAKSERWMPRRAADHLRDRDRLADRAAEAEDHCGDETAARLRQDDAADHLPTCRAERQRGLLEIARAR